MWIAAVLGTVLAYINQEPYKALGIDVFATNAEVKAAYQLLKNQPAFSSLPKEQQDKIQEAHNLLSNPSKRKAHDSKNSPPKKPLDHRIGERYPDPVRIRLPLPIQAAVNGYNLSLLTMGDRACPKCGGTGLASTNDKCGRCRGQGQINEVKNGQTVKVVCPACKGKKLKVGTTKCEECKGAKSVSGVPVQKILRIEKGYSEGTQITVPNLVDENTAEDAIFVLQTVENDGWSKKGQQLHYRLDVSLKESILGLNRSFKHLNGKDVAVKRERVKNGEKIVLPDLGLPLAKVPNGHGNLQVQLRVRIEDMSEEVRDRWEAFFRRFKI